MIRGQQSIDACVIRTPDRYENHHTTIFVLFVQRLIRNNNNNNNKKYRETLEASAFLECGVIEHPLGLLLTQQDNEHTVKTKISIYKRVNVAFY